ncbi:MAG: efflux RND transporter periplasmic adaptor subunit [Nitrospirae bacterium]|nr:MAG: efflux RND transporter periplasmic adaptor subunit [Nitrospirota bacterium]
MKNKAFLLVIALSVIFTGCGSKIDEGKARMKRPEVSGVATEAVTLQSIPDYYYTTGTVRAEDTSLVAPRVMGRVEKIYVREGDPVRKGDILLELHSPEIEAKVKAAREGMAEAEKAVSMAEKEKALAEKTYKRFLALFEEKAISEQEFDQIKTKRDLASLGYEMALKRLERARAGLDEAESYRGFTKLTSPVNGIVAEKKIDLGSMASPGMPVFIIERKNYIVEAWVNEELIGKIGKSTEVSLEFPSLNVKSAGRVKEVIRLVDPQSRSYRIKISPAPGIPHLRGGLFCRVRIPVGKREVLLVPEKAVIKRGQLRGVYTVNKEGIISLRYIKTGKEYPEGVEVLSGLVPGERVVVEGIDRAVDGGIVKDSTDAEQNPTEKQKPRNTIKGREG